MQLQKTTKMLKAIMCAFFACVLALGMASCIGVNQREGYTGGVAATINGEEIKEDDITDYVQKWREVNSLSDDTAFGQMMGTYGYTPSYLRDYFLSYFESRILVAKAAEEMGVEVTDEEVDEVFDSTRSQYSSDSAWETARTQMLYDSDDDYKADIKLALCQEKIQEIVEEDEQYSTVTDDSMNEYVTTNAEKLKKAKKSSHILFASDDEATAQSVLDQINAGTLDFAEAATQYSTDTGSASDGGNVGWDALTTFVTEYQTGLDALSKDQVSGLVTSSYGIHIIKCTDAVELGDAELTSYTQLPEELQTEIRTNLESNSDAYSTWYEQYKEEQDIEENDMPEGLIYDVEVISSSSTTTTTDSSSTDSDDSTDSSTDTTEPADETETTASDSGVTVTATDADGNTVDVSGSADATVTTN